MSEHTKPFLDFYGENRISPVSQNIEDLEMHFSRRNGLYLHCGIPPVLVRGASVLEVGPGTGHNAIHTNSLKPARYVLLDGNRASIDSCKATLEQHYPDTSNCEIVFSDFTKFSSNEKFDIVLCEGTIPGQKQPDVFTRKIGENVAPGGVLMITCIDYVSLLAETVRKIGAFLILENHSEDIQEKLTKIRPYFQKSLSTLKGMSRDLDDWIYDNFFQPFIGDGLFSIKDAIQALQNDFQAYATSPSFFQDWRWYKEIYTGEEDFNAKYKQMFDQNVHNFLDYRFEFSPISQDQSVILQEAAEAIFQLYVRCHQKKDYKKIAEELELLLETVHQVVSGFSASTSKAIQEFQVVLKQYNQDGVFAENFEEFNYWYGRGQQYISFIKN